MKKFIQKKEDFICNHCGEKVHGTGYTNHCPKCLWSQHIDINPGDRASQCLGMMRPVDFYLQNQDWIVVHECEKCGYKKKNKVTPEDDFDEVIRLEKAINDKKVRG